MVKLTKTLSLGLCALMFLFSCSKEMEEVSPSATLNDTATDAAKNATLTEPNPFTFSAISTNDNGKTWYFTVTNNGDSNSGPNKVLLGLLDCELKPIMLSTANVVALSLQPLDGNPKALDLSFDKGLCKDAITSSSVSFTGLGNGLRGGETLTFILTLNSAVQVTSAKVGLQIANNCLSATLNGPGCQEEETYCGLGQGYFHDPKKWPVQEVTIGGETYSVDDAVTLMTSDKKYGGKENGKGGIEVSKKAFSQGVTLLLNYKLGNIPETVLAEELADIEAFLATLDKLLVDNLTASDKNDPLAVAANDAAGRIGDWMDVNNCEEEN
ncbi:hypothetical protein CLV24_101357 [Pontibacter ummariensis]|uniref:Uncharacterized protein n=1 Tax=Pontibacter ummariensis TaxID=1610492 RepID=A0A239BG45_9BACT|nr:hypothetical protein [Pontibacter ummariensis]PRY16511.1 hypothetical protein CLV24_101357 [Pontibacter ummariensis]SNS06471.1 hypothetical protein SAMN06296052_101357 [Pontibacter ummariensis]